MITCYAWRPKASVPRVDNRHVIYTYDEDGNLASLGIPGYTFDYIYTNRSQVKWINDEATGAHHAYYEYDLRGNATLRNVYSSPVTVSNYNYDVYDRPTWVTHMLNGTTRTFNYGITIIATIANSSVVWAAHSGMLGMCSDMI